LSAAIVYQEWTRGTNPASLSESLFRGSLVLFSGLPQVSRLIARVRDILGQVFDSDDPEAPDPFLSSSGFSRLALRARRIVGEDDQVARHWADLLGSIGYSPATTWFDRLRLRVVPARADVEHGRLQALPPHRDTWGSGIMAQVNWWLPVYPLAEQRTMLLWPAAFRESIPNDSAEWDFGSFRDSPPSGYPLLPTARAAPRQSGTPVVIEPGQLLAFSGAHLHAGASDDSGRTRFSIDSRTVWEPDRLASRGAPNVDGEARAEGWRWFQPPTAVRAARATTRVAPTT